MQQVEHYLLQHLAVEPGFPGGAFFPQREIDLLLYRPIPELLCQLLHKDMQIAGLHAQLQRSALQFPEIHQLVDQAQQTMRIPVHGLEITAQRRVIVLFHHPFQRPEYQRQRRPEFMRDIGKELQLHLPDLFPFPRLQLPQLQPRPESYRIDTTRRYPAPPAKR